MPLRSPAAAVAFALSQSRWEHAMCLNFAWRCYAPNDSISSNLAAQGYPPPIGRAIDGWNGSPMKHPGDRNPPIGALVYYSAATSGATAGDGHVAIYVGGGMIRSTDAGGYGVNATVPLNWPERNWGRRYLGWTGDVLGHPIFTPAPTSGGSTPIKEDTLSAAEVADIKAHITAEANRVADYVRRESRPARLYRREDGTLWIAGPTIVPRAVRADTPDEHDLDILRGDTLILGAGDVTTPQKISDTAWASLIREHEAFRDYLAAGR